MMKKVLIKAALATLFAASSLTLASPFTTAAAQAQTQMRAEQLLQNMLSQSGKVSFTGQRELKVFRSNSAPLTANAEITFKNASNYQLKITDPDAIRGITFRSDSGKITAFFPDEKLYLFNGVPQTAYMPERIILSSLNNDYNKIMANYEVTRVADEIVNLTSAYVLDFVPKHRVTNGGKEYWFTPRRKYWIDKTTFQVLKEERYWDMSSNPYSVVRFTTFTPDPNVVVPAFKAQDNLNRIDLAGKTKNSFNTYRTAAEAEAAEKVKINLPNYVPKGFSLKDIQVFSLFGARIQVLNYTDGLNDMMLTIRPEQYGFVTLLAGAFSLNLIKKITDLSYQAPNNYNSVATEQRIAVAFGDMSPFELQRVASSLSLTR